MTGLLTWRGIRKHDFLLLLLHLESSLLGVRRPASRVLWWRSLWRSSSEGETAAGASTPGPGRQDGKGSDPRRLLWKVTAAATLSVSLILVLVPCWGVWGGRRERVEGGGCESTCNCGWRSFDVHAESGGMGGAKRAGGGAERKELSNYLFSVGLLAQALSRPSPRPSPRPPR